MAELPPYRYLALALVAGIVVPGVLQYLLKEAGYGLVGDVVWVVGYVGMAAVIWFGWISRIDLTGPAE